ncbi:alpha-amylase family glycosyl hydrolase [Parasphaerochaeta coccoides]|uniref:Sucrose phosphorylase n=1 Tax=Parasphaerochaeta coccoides (strain ATCC BAA-1237 / DSM 17374 / SPN1) TaxID=760011 RepID=F4GJ85_PARC1|nr:alpha-amylase family glycosyl hydrolase [Parasphaerochaeta coccoides]AEC01725.1 Sucrose phosphorylase [Parasphaerochaeta coccoides DSM 17374]
MIDRTVKDRMSSLLAGIYPEDDSETLLDMIDNLVERHRRDIVTHRLKNGASNARYEFDQNDVFLITYADVAREQDASPLASLHRLLAEHANGLFSFVHILPFYPYSSDDGFSVVDYKEVNPRFGSWSDVERLAGRYRLMFDAVLNHISVKSHWFTGFLAGESTFEQFFIERDVNADYSRVVRPRITPLFTSFESLKGTKDLWTTFSPDQVDLNFHNPRVLLAVLDVLLFYVARGASAIRLDAINYLWKEPGTICSNLPQCHAVIRLMRALLDAVCPWIPLITETNILHADNITYLADGFSEAQMVYQFALPPLVVHSYLSGDMSKLSAWAKELTFGEGTSYFNFLASHDGVGIIPVGNILDKREMDALAALAVARGGYVSYKSNDGGEDVPYELNCTWWELISDPAEPMETNIRKYVASHAILLALRGVPALYCHSLFGAENDHEGVRETGMKRSVNRRKYALTELRQNLENGRTGRIYGEVKALIETRKKFRAFSPASGQEIMELHPAVLAVLRTAGDADQVLTLANASGHPVTVRLPIPGCLIAGSGALNAGHIMLEPHGFAWLEVER